MTSTDLNMEDGNSDNIAIINEMIDKFNKINHNPVKNISINIKTNIRTYKLIRLNDEQYYLLRKNSISVRQDYSHLISLFLDKQIIYSSLSRMYITLKKLFGESGNYYDNWKGSFSFPFLIYFCSDEEIFGYLMNTYNTRSSIEFAIAKLIHADDQQYDRNVLHEPFEEFPREEINYFIDFFVGFLTGYFETIKSKINEFFFQTVQSNLILFGCKNGCYFDNQYDNEKEFHQEIQALLNYNAGEEGEGVSR